jgi:hypothetical protein
MMTVMRRVGVSNGFSLLLSVLYRYNLCLHRGDPIYPIIRKEWK